MIKTKKLAFDNGESYSMEIRDETTETNSDGSTAPPSRVRCTITLLFVLKL